MVGKVGTFSVFSYWFTMSLFRCVEIVTGNDVFQVLQLI